MEARADAKPSSRCGMTSSLHLAQESRARRGELLADEQIEFVLDRIGLTEERCLQLAAENVGPDARKKLKGILSKYRKSLHPFGDCKRDQIANGLPEKLANERCATLKDLIMGTKNWRKGGKKMHASEDTAVLDCPVLDDDVVVLLEAVDTRALAELLAEGDDDGSS